MWTSQLPFYDSALRVHSATGLPSTTCLTALHLPFCVYPSLADALTLRSHYPSPIIFPHAPTPL